MPENAYQIVMSQKPFFKFFHEFGAFLGRKMLMQNLECLFENVSNDLYYLQYGSLKLKTSKEKKDMKLLFWCAVKTDEIPNPSYKKNCSHA